MLPSGKKDNTDQTTALICLRRRGKKSNTLDEPSTNGRVPDNRARWKTLHAPRFSDTLKCHRHTASVAGTLEKSNPFAIGETERHWASEERLGLSALPRKRRVHCWENAVSGREEEGGAGGGGGGGGGGRDIKWEIGLKEKKRNKSDDFS